MSITELKEIDSTDLQQSIKALDYLVRLVPVTILVPLSEVVDTVTDANAWKKGDEWDADYDFSNFNGYRVDDHAADEAIKDELIEKARGW